MARRLKFAPNNFPVSQRVLNQKHQTPRGERSCIASWTKNLMTCRNREEQKRKEGTAKSRLVFTLGRLLNQNSRKQIFLLMSVCLGDFFGSYLYSRAKSNEIKFEKGTWAERKIPNPSPIVFWFDLDSAFARLYLLLNETQKKKQTLPPPTPPKKNRQLRRLN